MIRFVGVYPLGCHPLNAAAVPVSLNHDQIHVVDVLHGQCESDTIGKFNDNMRNCQLVLVTDSAHVRVRVRVAI